MNLTVEQLAEEIRKATSLADLKRLVGASAEQNAQSADRLAQIDAIVATHGTDARTYPPAVEDRYQRLWDAQNRFEAEYC